ncbi:transposase family protein [Almyronema epifaneia]|uniref:Transposase family protein n=1 Tax=Almyronema epifaneia S1 TaxID=2991925 RepID=A0ABW6IM45_9CYAN
MDIATTQPTAGCPCCQQSSHRIHSRYPRTLHDLNWADYGVTLHLTVRKFFCDVTICPQGIFTERLPQFCAPYARRTHRLNQYLIGLPSIWGGRPEPDRLSATVMGSVCTHCCER